MSAKPRATKLKVLLCGRIAIVKQYEKEIWYNTLYPKLKKNKTGWGEREKTEEEKKDIRKRANYRARNNVYNLISTNAWFWKKEDNSMYLPTFLTLTYKENITDIKEANYLHSKFIKRLNYHTYGTKKMQLKYLSVIEFQKRGAIHYHIIFFNLPFIHKTEISEIWDQGFILIKKIDDKQNVAGYLTKYMSKGNNDIRLDKKKRYMCSRKLLRPIEINVQEEALRLIEKIPEKYIKKTGSFETDYFGQVTVTEYDFGKGKTIKDVVY